MFKRAKKAFPPRTGTWPNGEPESVRDAADGIVTPHSYSVYMVVIGGYDAYELVSVFEDRDAARAKARDLNESFARTGTAGCCACIHHSARVEEITFYPAGAPWLAL